MNTVTLSTLVADTGETPRVINHWTDIGILRSQHGSERRGRGNRRFYAAEPFYGERKYALLASAMNRLRLPLVDIKMLIYGDRLNYDPIETLDYAEPKHMAAAIRIREQRAEDVKNNPGFVHPYEAALAGEADIIAIIASRPNDPVTPFRTAYLREMHFFPGNDIGDAHDIINQKTHQANYKMLRNLMAENEIAVALNLSKIFAPLRSIPATSEAETEAD